MLSSRAYGIAPTLCACISSFQAHARCGYHVRMTITAGCSSRRSLELKEKYPHRLRRGHSIFETFSTEEGPQATQNATVPPHKCHLSKSDHVLRLGWALQRPSRGSVTDSSKTQRKVSQGFGKPWTESQTTFNSSSQAQIQVSLFTYAVQ